MTDAHELGRESVSDTGRFVSQSEHEEEAVELAQKHTTEDHGQAFLDEELQEEHLQVV